MKDVIWKVSLGPKANGIKFVFSPNQSNLNLEVASIFLCNAYNMWVKLGGYTVGDIIKRQTD